MPDNGYSPLDFKALEACCWKAYFDFEDTHLQPGREDWVRHPDCIAELVAFVRTIWVEDCHGVPCDWPWNNECVMQCFICVRKKNREVKDEMKANMKNGTLFPIPDIGVIYFIRNSRGHIKIGHTYGEPKKRLKELQTAESEPLSLEGWMPGTERQEGALHVRFAAFHTRPRGEWFFLSPELKSLIQESTRCQ